MATFEATIDIPEDNEATRNHFWGFVVSTDGDFAKGDTEITEVQVANRENPDDYHKPDSFSWNTATEPYQFKATDPEDFEIGSIKVRGSVDGAGPDSGVEVRVIFGSFAESVWTDVEFDRDTSRRRMFLFGARIGDEVTIDLPGGQTMVLEVVAFDE